MSHNTHEGIRNLSSVSSISLALLFFYFIINYNFSLKNILNHLFFICGKKLVNKIKCCLGPEMRYALRLNRGVTKPNRSHSNFQLPTKRDIIFGSQEAREGARNLFYLKF